MHRYNYTAGKITVQDSLNILLLSYQQLMLILGKYYEARYLLQKNV